VLLVDDVCVRVQAHCNPLSNNNSFQYPLSPATADWSPYYPNIPEDNRIVRHVDVGMGYGGLTVALATLFPDKLVLGMEIRAKLVEYVKLKIEALRTEGSSAYQNASCMRTNCMRYLPNYFTKGSYVYHVWGASGTLLPSYIRTTRENLLLFS
jgi:tRNA (guanine-N7-)-methyltransferase